MSSPEAHHEEAGASHAGKGLFTEIAEIFSPEKAIPEIGQELLGKPATTLIQKDLTEKTFTELGIGMVSAGSKPNKGGGGGGGHGGGGGGHAAH